MFYYCYYKKKLKYISKKEYEDLVKNSFYKPITATSVSVRLNNRKLSDIIDLNGVFIINEPSKSISQSEMSSLLSKTNIYFKSRRDITKIIETFSLFYAVAFYRKDLSENYIKNNIPGLKIRDLLLRYLKNRKQSIERDEEVIREDIIKLQKRKEEYSKLYNFLSDEEKLLFEINEIGEIEET